MAATKFTSGSYNSDRDIWVDFLSPAALCVPLNQGWDITYFRYNFTSWLSGSKLDVADTAALSESKFLILLILDTKFLKLMEVDFSFNCLGHQALIKELTINNYCTLNDNCLLTSARLYYTIQNKNIVEGLPVFFAGRHNMYNN